MAAHLAELASRTIEALKSRGNLLAVLVTLSIVLRQYLARKPKLITDLNRVGQTEGHLPSVESVFDVIIIGGGTAGCVLASRLSEDPSIRVLLLESGGSGISLVESRIPIAYGRLMHTKHAWNYYTVPQVGLGGKSKYWPQGRMLGGSSSMNAMMFHYGCPEDYDEWAKNNSDPGSELWSYANLSRHFKNFEKYSTSKKFPLVDATLRGSSGPVDIGFFGNFSQVAANFIDSCVNVGIPHVHDVNTSVGTLGVTKLMTYINSRGRRVSSESAYLSPEVLSRPNLKVAIHAQVTRILFETVDGKPKAVGVEFANAAKTRFQASAKKEVILSAGAIHTPQVLMLSGVGPAAQLAAHAIPVVHDLPGVGNHLTDHIVVDVRYRDKSKTSLLLMGELPLLNRLKVHWYTLQWLIFGTGPLTSNIGEAASFVRSTDPDLFATIQSPPPAEDSTSGPGAPDIEYFVTPTAYTEHGHGPIPSGHLWSLHQILLRPTSRGSITLKSADPYEGPIIDPQYLSTDHDVNVLVRGLKLLLKVARTSPLADALDETETDPALDQDLHKVDDEALAQVVRDRVETVYHPCSTARMAPLEEGGVVDPYLRVHGIRNLRVVDASVFPSIVAGHTAGTVFAIAEQAAELIKRDIVG